MVVASGMLPLYIRSNDVKKNRRVLCTVHETLVYCNTYWNIMMEYDLRLPCSTLGSVSWC